MPTQPGYGRHKQDNQEVKQPKIEAKAKPDIIEGVDQTKDTVEGALNALGIEKREVKQDLAIFKDDQVIKDQEIPQENANQINYKQTIQAGNEELINKHWWLKEIQRIANENNCFVQFADFVDQNNNPIGIMSVRAFTERDNSYVSNPYKSFVIDYSGNFYDKRIKMFATTDGSYILDLSTITYNKLNAFNVTMIDDRSNKRNSERINDKFFNCFFKSGSIMLIDSKDGMYSSKVRELNTYVNLASTPTKYMDKLDRSIARDRLIKAMEIKDPNSSPFASARTMDPYCRFNYYGFDKRSKVFMIENANTEIPIYIIFNNNGHSTIETNREKAISIYEAFKSEYYKKEKENSIKSYSNYKK